MNKLLNSVPLCYLLPSSTHPTITIPLHAILGTHFLRYAYDITDTTNGITIELLIGYVCFISTIMFALRSLSFHTKLVELRKLKADSENVKLTNKLKFSITVQVGLTMFVFFSLVIQRLFDL